MFSKGATVGQVRDTIEHKYGEKIANSSVDRYKTKHLDPQKAMVGGQKAVIGRVTRKIGEKGLTAGVNALLWQSLQEMTVPQLTALKKVLNDGKKVRLMEKKLDLYAEEHEQKMEERRAALAKDDESEVSDPVEDYEKAQRVVEQVKEIFGIGRTPLKPLVLRAGSQPPPPDVPTVRAEPART
jgi:hypothetical protein